MIGTSSTFRGWVRVRVLGYGSGVRDRKVKSRDCALASDLIRAQQGGGGKIGLISGKFLQTGKKFAFLLEIDIFLEFRLYILDLSPDVDRRLLCEHLLSLHNPVVRAARALAGRYTERGDRPNFEPRARTDILV